jgi:hypothetical protein
MSGIEKTIEFHPRAWKLMQKRKPFVVVANDEPYYFKVYALIRSYETYAGRWTQEDEDYYLAQLRHSHHCAGCGEDIPFNDTVYWDAINKVAYHVSCQDKTYSRSK